MEKAKKKLEGIVENVDVTEAEKARQVRQYVLGLLLFVLLSITNSIIYFKIIIYLEYIRNWNSQNKKLNM